MKLRRVLAAVLVLVLMLAGCGAEEMVDDSAIRADAEVLLAAFMHDDYDACRAVVDASVADADLEAIFPSIAEELADLGTYEMTAVGWNQKQSADADQVSVQYLVSGEGGKYYLTVAKVEGQAGLAGFQIAAAEEDAEPTKPAGPVHWIFTVVGMAELAFVVWMLIDCARRKMKRKWLWIPLILLAGVILNFTIRDGGLTFRFNAGLYLTMTSLSTFVAGGFRVSLFIPVGAIVYFLRRRKMTGTEGKAAKAAEEAE